MRQSKRPAQETQEEVLQLLLRRSESWPRIPANQRSRLKRSLVMYRRTHRLPAKQLKRCSRVLKREIKVLSRPNRYFRKSLNPAKRLSIFHEKYSRPLDHKSRLS